MEYLKTSFGLDIGLRALLPGRQHDARSNEFERVRPKEDARRD